MAFSLSAPSPTDTRRSTGHMIMHAAAIAVATLTHILSEAVRCLAADASVPNALFQVSSRNVSATFPLEVSMDTWVENCWIMINIWTLAWLLHAIASMCQRSGLDRLSCNPEIHSALFFLVWITINVARMSGIVNWSRYDLVGTLLSRLLVVVCSFSSLGMSYRNLAHHMSWLQINHPSHICWIQYLAQNSMAVFSCWSLLEALVVLGQVLCYLGGLQDSLVSSIILTLILLFIITWFVFETILFPRPLRHTFAVHPTLILGLGAMFTGSYRVHAITANTVYCGVLMVLATCFSISRMVSGCFLTDDPSVNSLVELDLTSEGCKTVCQAENNKKTKHVVCAPHILKKILRNA